MPTRAGRMARQGREVKTSVCLIRIEFTGYLPNREWTAISWSPGRGVGPPRRGRQCLSRAGNRPRSSTPCYGGHTAGIPQGRPCRSGGGAQNRAFVLAHLLPPVMNKFPLPAWVAADDVLDGSGSRDPASSGCALHSALADLLQSSPLGADPWHPPLACLSAGGQWPGRRDDDATRPGPSSLTSS